ncbi:MAG: transcription elongation factor GreA [Bacteroidetes bacterium]|nr:transcription elongation factor GreA [Bacteroidota bacterium]
MSNETIYLTLEGRGRLEKELRELKTSGRKDMASRIAEARSHGDLKENAEYDAAKEAQGHLEMRIAKLEETLSKSRILDTSNLDLTKVTVLSTVKVANSKTNKEFNYTLVSEEEADLASGKISTLSPIGRALLGHSIGDLVEIKVPAGLLTLKVLDITRQ